jgi:hypothetical protein
MRLRNATFSLNLASDKVPTHMNVTFFYIIGCAKNALTQTGKALSDTLTSKREHIILLKPNIYKVNLSFAVYFRSLSIIHMENKYNSTINGINKQ